MEAWELAVAFAGAFVAGFLGSIVGLVLGSLRLPAVLLASGSTAAAAGTNIAVSAVAALTGGLTHARAGRVSWRIVAWMAPPSALQLPALPDTLQLSMPSLPSISVTHPSPGDMLLQPKAANAINSDAPTIPVSRFMVFSLIRRPR